MFLTKIKADSGDRSSWGGFWFNPTPMRAESANVTADSALQLSAVYACVRVLSDTVSTLPFNMYRTMPSGAKKQIRDHWLYRLFAKRPNDYQNPLEFREMMMGHLALRGNAFAQIVANRKGEVTDLHPIHPDLVTIEMLSNLNWRYRVKNQDGTETILARTDVFHIKGLSPNGVVGYNPIALARKMLATGLAAQDYGVRFFENDAAPSGGWIEHPTNFKDKEARNLWRDAWQEMQGGKNKGKVAVLEYGLKYHEGVSVKNSDAQFIETKRMSRSEIATMFRVPPHMIGDLDKATFSNIEQQSIDFVTHSMMPWLVRWEEAIKYTFLDPEDDDLCVSFPVISLLRGDMAARSAYINTCVMNGTMTRNEARLMEDRDPLPGLDEPLRMLNMVTERDAQEEQDEAEAAEANGGKPRAPAPADARLVALASAAAERVARKEVEMTAKAAKSPDWRAALCIAYAKHAAFVGAAIGISAERAEEYCSEQVALIQESGGIDPDDIAEIARCKLERLALQG
jgi:HK97 family phage portal protein